jgi:hypothetical protein
MAVLVPHTYPYLVCPAEDDKSVQCGRTMPLPRSSQLGKSLNIPGLPKDETREIFVNPECGHVCDYTESDVHWGLAPHVDPNQPRRPFSQLVEWNCGVENCRTRVVVQRPTRDAIEEEELLTEARRKWIFVSAHCLGTGRHLLTKVPDDAWAWEIWAADAGP